MRGLIFSDIDGTIMPDEKVISKYTAEAIRNLDKYGYGFVLVTGKNRQKTEEVARAYGGSRYIITSNGGEVFDCLERKVIYIVPIERKVVEKLYNKAKKLNVRFILNVDADFRFTTELKHNDGSERLLTSLDEVFNSYNVVGGLFDNIPEEFIPEIKAYIIEADTVDIANQRVDNIRNFVDFNSVYADKGVAIRKLIKYLNVDYEKTISIGNERNDVEMFSATHTSVTVKNAPKEIKQMVDKVVDSVNNDGVGKFLNALIKSN